MNADNLIGLIISIALGIFLLAALLFPDRF
ncbi:MAG TPA: K(+)-transporting ATPase subunit F [Sporichthyaceae bacterium]|nr:K(+)-transporting ATPase subunit F [Sporichthyaceae bacterium]